MGGFVAGQARLASSVGANVWGLMLQQNIHLMSHFLFSVAWVLACYHDDPFGVSLRQESDFYVYLEMSFFFIRK